MKKYQLKGCQVSFIISLNNIAIKLSTCYIKDGYTYKKFFPSEDDHKHTWYTEKCCCISHVLIKPSPRWPIKVQLSNISYHYL